MTQGRMVFKQKKIKLVLLGVSIILLGIGLRWGGLPSCGAIELVLARFGLWAPFVFVGTYSVATILFVPGTLLSLVGGVFFGPWFGTVYVMVGALIGAQIAFFLSRTVLHDLVEAYLGKQAWYGRLRANFIENRIFYLLFLRLSPVFPFNGLNYACGLLPIGAKEYFLAGLLGMLPGTFAYVYAGSTLGCAVLEGSRSLSRELGFQLLLSLTVLSLLSLLPVILKKWKKNGRS